MPNVVYLKGRLRSLGFVAYMDVLVVASLQGSAASSLLLKEEQFWAWRMAEEVPPLVLLLVVLLPLPLLLEVLVLMREQERAQREVELVQLLEERH